MIKVLPFWKALLDIAAVEINFLTDRDIVKVPGLDGLERNEDPSNAWPSESKRDFLKVRNLGKVEWDLEYRGCA